MTAQIIITTPLPQFTEIALNVSKELGIETIIVEGVLEDAAEQVVKICRDNNIVVIVSRGGTAAAIKKVVDVPVICAEANDFDILMALWEARKFSNHIGYLSYNDQYEPYEFKYLEDIVGVEIQHFHFKDRQDFVREIRRAKENGVGVIVSGSSFAIDLIKAEGLQGIPVNVSRRTMTIALQRAKLLLEVRNNDKKRTEQLQTIVNLSQDGIIAYDQEGIIQTCNPMAERIFNVSKKQIIGHNLNTLNIEKGLNDLLNSQNELIDEVVINHNLNLIVNCAPIIVDNQYFGAVATFREVAKLQQLEENVRRQLHTGGLVAKAQFKDILGHSKRIKHCIERAQKFATTDSTILILGESGTGKELFAQSIHNLSERKERAFVAVNCAALPEALLESELFGYDEGAFTGARRGGKPGIFEMAHNGTIFLDELGALPKSVQARLLRVLQERQIFRLGGNKVIPVNVRIIAATNEDIRSAVETGAFRSDLFYRLNVLNIEVPPLRERIDDLPDLIHYFLKLFNKRFRKSVKNISPELMNGFVEYHWPGNIRELINYLERMVILADGPTIGLEHLSSNEIFVQNKNDSDEAIMEAKQQRNAQALWVNQGTLQSMENDIIRWYMEKYDGNKTKIAEELGICRTTLWKKLNKMDD